ncbi:MAG: hypothetical protein H6Q55_2679, partial [Deltaproteobacteria bacterium]|nr:hypothetical protein [Deltaproteobacteria bacterium]
TPIKQGKSASERLSNSHKGWVGCRNATGTTAYKTKTLNA